MLHDPGQAEAVVAAHDYRKSMKAGRQMPILAGSWVGGLASRRFQDMIAGRDVAASSRGE
jgi:hypothetical protein